MIDRLRNLDICEFVTFVASQNHPACPAGAYCPLHLFQAHHLVFG